MWSLKSTCSRTRWSKRRRPAHTRGRECLRDVRSHEHCVRARARCRNGPILAARWCFVPHAARTASTGARRCGTRLRPCHAWNPPVPPIWSDNSPRACVRLTSAHPCSSEVALHHTSTHGLDSESTGRNRAVPIDATSADTWVLAAVMYLRPAGGWGVRHRLVSRGQASASACLHRLTACPPLGSGRWCLGSAAPAPRSRL